MNVAVILAGGSGNRFGSERPKQFLEVAGKQIIEHSIDAFENNALIDEICIVTRADYLDEVKALVARGGYSKVKKVIQGGQERYTSSVAAIDAYPDDSINMLFHDAVRPVVSDRMITDCIEALRQYNAVTVAAMTTDTIIAVDDRNCIREIPARATLRNVQTPQGFKAGIIREAYKLALNDPDFTTTDDCGTVKKYLPDEPIYVVQGDSSNMKLTYTEDLTIIEKLLQLRTQNNTTASNKKQIL